MVMLTGEEVYSLTHRGYKKSFQEGNITKLLESVLYDLRKENGGFNGGSGTVFTSTNSGIFTPTYGDSKSTRKRKKKINAKKKGQGLISGKKTSGVEKLQRWMSDKSPVKKLKKDVKVSKATLTGSSSGNQTQPVNNIMRIDWQKPHKGMIRHKENDDPKFVERYDSDEKNQNLSVIEQNDFQRKVTEMDQDNKRKTRGRDTSELEICTFLKFAGLSMVWAEEPLKITVPVPATKLVLFCKSQSPPIVILLL